MFPKRLSKLPQTNKSFLRVTSFEAGMTCRSQENNIPIKQAVFAKNFDYVSGALENGTGFGAYAVSSLSLVDKTAMLANIKALGKIKFVFHYRKTNAVGARCDKLLLIDDGLHLYYVELDGSSTACTNLNVTFTSIPVGVNYNLNSTDVAILCSPTDSMVVWNGTDAPYSVVDAPKISSMAVHRERLFVTSTNSESNSVWFSDDLDPTNWNLSLNEAGFVQFSDERGNAQKVISFLDYVFVFREYGISRISAYGSQEDFSVSHLFTSSGKIYANTVTICGDRVIFLAEDGLYAFDGLNTICILPDIKNYFMGVQNSGATATFAGGKFYLICNMCFGEHSQNQFDQVLFKYDVKNKDFSISMGPSMLTIAPLFLENETQVLVGVNPESNQTGLVKLDKSGKNQESVLSCLWKSPKTDLGYPEKEKIVRKIRLQTNSNVTVSITTENDTKTLTFLGSSLVTTKSLELCGKQFQFSISSSVQNAKISGLMFEISLLDR